MLENLSFVLLGLSVIVAALSFIGAHNSPIPVPNISKAGCTVAIGMVVAGFALGMYPPISHFNECATTCETALQDMEGDHGAFDVHVSPGRVDYKACHKGALEADSKARLAAEEAGDPSAFTPSDKDLIESRCMGAAVERCTVACFEARND
jgi:hypothetical protein